MARSETKLAKADHAHVNEMGYKTNALGKALNNLLEAPTWMAGQS